jgi:2-polyprenyl-3-methyl-5-hydroxy-6-metoxy-1,4-benzoquinol methylase
MSQPQADAEAERRRRESEFHDQWAAGHFDPAETLVDESFTAITATANQHILEVFGDVRGKKILDYGCGSAEGGIYLAKRGARVVGMDVSAGMLDSAHRLAAHHGVQIETRLVQSQQIPAADQEFDLIYGNGVLHHVTLETAMPELARVLRPEGKGCFIEPLPDNPAINVYRRMASKLRTADERPITAADVASFQRWFGSVTHREFWLTTLLVFLKFYLVDRTHPNEERYWKKIYTDAHKLERLFRPLKRLDDLLLDKVPPLRRLCWLTVITLAQPRLSAGAGAQA